MKKLLLSALIALAAVYGAFAQEFVLNNGAEPGSLDPLHLEGVNEHHIYLALFEGLTINDPKTNRAIPGAAEKWSFNKAMDVVTFTIRKAVWSDGTPVTAQNVRDSWLRKLDPKEAAQYADLLYIIKGAEAYNTEKGSAADVGIKVVNANTLEVTLKGPTPHFPDMAAHYAFAIVPMHAIAKFGGEWTKPANMVVNGPFVLTEWTPQKQIVVTPNAKYWDAKNVKLKKITFMSIEDENTAYQMYKAGQLDWIETVPSEMMDEIKLRKDYIVSPRYGTYYLKVNFKDPVFAKADVRKALSMAFDRKALVEKVTKAGEVAAYSFVPASAGYTPAKGLGYNIAEAKKLLAKAGYADGKGLPEITLLYNTSANHKRIMEFLQQEWKANLGVEVKLQNLEFATLLDTLHQGQFQLGRQGWIGDYLDPSTFTDMWITGSTQNDGQYSSPAYDALIKKAATQSGDARYASLMAAEKILINEDHAIIPIYFYVNKDMIDLSKWTGWYGNPLGIHPWKFISKK